jgi:hypothetical protein
MKKDNYWDTPCDLCNGWFRGKKGLVVHKTKSHSSQEPLTNTMEWETFDEWLQYKHSEWHPELLDDDLPDAYGEWIAGLSEDEWIDYGNRFAKEQLKAQALSYKKRIEGLDKDELDPKVLPDNYHYKNGWNDALAHLIQEMEKKV